MHHHSYLCTDCGLKRTRSVFKDSKLNDKLHHDSTKCEMLVQNILAPHSIDILLNDLRGQKVLLNYEWCFE